MGDGNSACDDTGDCDGDGDGDDDGDGRYWPCPACRGICSCAACKRQNRKKGKSAAITKKNSAVDMIAVEGIAGGDGLSSPSSISKAFAW